MSDIIDSLTRDSPFFYLKEKRERERKERDPMERAYNDWKNAKSGFYKGPRHDFRLMVECLKHYFELRPRYRDASVYPLDLSTIKTDTEPDDSE